MTYWVILKIPFTSLIKRFLETQLLFRIGELSDATERLERHIWLDTKFTWTTQKGSLVKTITSYHQVRIAGSQIRLLFLQHSLEKMMPPRLSDRSWVKKLVSYGICHWDHLAHASLQPNSHLSSMTASLQRSQKTLKSQRLPDQGIFLCRCTTLAVYHQITVNLFLQSVFDLTILNLLSKSVAFNSNSAELHI